MSTNYSPTIVTDGIVGNWDPKAREYPPRGLATTWTDYGSQSANYTILGDDGIILKDTSASWIGYFPATLTSLGGYTVTFDVVADVAASSFVVNNDGTSNNAFLKTISVGTTLTRITLKGTITSISSPVCQVFLRRNSGGNITITNFRLFESGPWLYDGAGGSDGRGSGNNGLMHNGTCLSFDGTDDRIELDDLDSQFSDYFTLSVWLRPLDVTGETWVFAGENGGGIGFYIRQSNDDLIFRHNGIGDGTTNVTAFFSYSEANQAAPVSTAWIHCVFNWDGVNTNVYRDGVRVGGEAATGTLAADAFNDPRIGDDSAAGDREWYGEMADFRLYNVALSASQVTEIYNDSKVIIPSNVSQTNLIVWYPMTEGAGDLVYDGSGKGYTGTFSNAPTWTTAQTGCPQLVEGYNRPMLFDGSSDYVSIADSATLSVGSTFTISYWFYPEDITTESYHIAKNTYTGNQKSYAVNQYSTGKTQFRVSGDGSSHIECTGDTVMSNKAWHHIVHVFDGGAGTKLKGWVDGTAQSFNQQPNVTAAYDSTSILCLGTRDAGLTAPFAGIINEVIIYNSALDATDAAALYATGPNGGPLPPDPRTMSYSSSTTSANIMGYWRNDNNVTLTDLSGNSNTGTAIGSPDALLFKQGYNGSASTSTGRDNQGFPLLYENNGAVGFSGALTDEGIRVTGIDPTALSYITVSAWVKIVGNTNWGTIAMQADTNSFDEGWGLNFNGTSDQFQFWVDIYTDPAQADISSHYGKWLHVVGTYNGTDQKLYFNGVEIDSEADTWTNKGSATNEIHVGTGIGTANTIFRYGLNGQIGNIQIYNRALSVAEITQNYNAQKSRFT